MITSLSQAPWPWCLDQPLRPNSAAPGSALAGPLAEDPEPPAEGAAGAAAVAAPLRPADQPAPQRVPRDEAGQAPGRRPGGGAGADRGGQEVLGGQGQVQAGRRGVDLYV